MADGGVGVFKARGLHRTLASSDDPQSKGGVSTRMPGAALAGRRPECAAGRSMTRRATGSASPRPPRYSSNGAGVRRRMNQPVSRALRRTTIAASTSVPSRSPAAVGHDGAGSLRSRKAACGQRRDGRGDRARSPVAHRWPAGRREPSNLDTAILAPHAHPRQLRDQRERVEYPAARPPARASSFPNLAHLGDSATDPLARSLGFLQHLLLLAR